MWMKTKKLRPYNNHHIYLIILRAKCFGYKLNKYKLLIGYVNIQLTEQFSSFHTIILIRKSKPAYSL